MPARRGPRLFGPEGEAATLYEKVTGGEIPKGTTGELDYLLNVFNLLQAAGPGPDARERRARGIASRRWATRTRPPGVWSFGASIDGEGSDHTAVEDSKEVYWDADAPSEEPEPDQDAGRLPPDLRRPALRASASGRGGTGARRGAGDRPSTRCPGRSPPGVRAAPLLKAVAAVAASRPLWCSSSRRSPAASRRHRLLGAVFGVLYALNAIGLVLVFRANRVVNFAQAEFGVIAAVLAIQFVLQWDWNFFAAVAAGSSSPPRSPA